MGDVLNPSDNVDSVRDTAIFNFTISVPSNSTGAYFFITAYVDFNNSVEVFTIENSTLEYVVIDPLVRADADVSKK